MTDREKACPGKELENMTTEQLDELLQEELRKEVPDESVVLPILQVLQEREKEYPVEIPEGITENPAKVNDHTEHAKPKSRRTLALRIAAVAAVLGIVLMAVPRTVGAESIFQVLFRWTESVFEFLTPGSNNDDPPDGYVFTTDHEGLQQLYDTMVAEGVTDPVVPMWLPEGYELMEIKIDVLAGGKKVFAKFVNGNEGVLLSYMIRHGQTATQYEKGNPDAEIYEVDGYLHYILANKDNISVVWTHNAVECMVNANIDSEDVRRIIASIYGRY